MQYSWLHTVIYFGILFAEYPTNFIVQKVPIAKYLAANIFLWGLTLTMTCFGFNFRILAALRVLLGIFEAVSQPTFLLLSSMWYKREEQAHIVTYWFVSSSSLSTQYQCLPCLGNGRCSLKVIVLGDQPNRIAERSPRNLWRPFRLRHEPCPFSCVEILAIPLHPTRLDHLRLVGICLVVDARQSHAGKVLLRN